jgi:hypothetical protein
MAGNPLINKYTVMASTADSAKAAHPLKKIPAIRSPGDFFLRPPKIDSF